MTALDAGFEDHAEHEYALFVAEHPALDERHHQQESLDEQAAAGRATGRVSREATTEPVSRRV